MQILKKRTTLVTPNEGKDNGITNYDSWIDDTFQNTRTDRRFREWWFSNYFLGSAVNNQIGLEWTVSSSGQWNSASSLNTFVWNYIWTFNAPYSASYDFMTDCTLLYKYIIENTSIKTLSFTIANTKAFYTAYHTYQPFGVATTMKQNRQGILCSKGEPITGSLALSYLSDEKDTLNAPFTNEMLINGFVNPSDKNTTPRLNALRMHIQSWAYSYKP